MSNGNLNLSTFIRDEIDLILDEWDSFARSIEPPALVMTDNDLRDHAREMLIVIAADLDTPQSNLERDQKSKGLSPQSIGEKTSEVHAEARLRSGYSVTQLVSEYRALRSSVLTLWGERATIDTPSAVADMIRFNEAIDQAMSESVSRYQKLVTQSQNMFLAILGHDLRNPLSAVTAGASYMSHVPEIPQSVSTIALRIHRSAQRMERLVNDLIDFSRTHIGKKISIRPSQVELIGICKQVISEMQTSDPARQIELICPPLLPAYVDEDRVSQVISNLVGNAFQHGDKSKTVKVAVNCDEFEIKITVTNFGREIPLDRISSIFDPLIRLNHSPTPAKNTSLGLGLFISREIVRAHQGEISVTSSSETGTAFIVSLPIVS